MKAASITELKKQLVQLDPGDLLEACLRLARFKNDNKELLTYLLFLADDELGYAKLLCEGIDTQFMDAPNAQKKTLRKIIRWMDKCLRFSGVKETEVQVRIHFLRALTNSPIPYRSNKVMTNMVTGQLRKIDRAMEKFHDDLKFDFGQELQELRV